MNHSLFISLPIERHLGFFQFGAIVNKTSQKIHFRFMNQSIKYPWKEKFRNINAITGLPASIVPQLYILVSGQKDPSKF